MLVCNISLRPQRFAISADLTETATANDTSTTGTLVLATLVDDPASVNEIVDAYLGEIMVEAASSADLIDAAFSYAAAISETTSAGDVPDATTGLIITWNAADISTYSGSSWPTFSNGSLSVQTAAGNNQAVRANAAKTGTKYIEFTWDNIAAGANTVGITTGSNTMDNLALSLTSSIGAATNGNIYRNGSPVGTYGSVSIGQTVCIAVDLTAKKFWARIGSGNWNGSSSNDPATGVGGIDFSAIDLSSGAYPFAMLTFTPTKVTANFGASSFLFAVPSGFSAWG